MTHNEIASGANRARSADKDPKCSDLTIVDE